MKKLITSVIVALGLFLSAFLTSSAMAGSWAIGIVGGSGTIETDGSETEGTGDKEKTTYIQDESILYGSIFAEYTLGERWGMTFGASYTPVDQTLGVKERTDSNTMLTYTPTPEDDGTYRAEAEISDHATFYVEPTYMPSKNLGFYVKGGIAQVTVISLENIKLGEDSSAYGNETIYGGMYGIGMKAVHDNGLMLKLEAIRINYDTVKLTSTTGNKNIIEADPEQDAIRIAIGYQF